MVQEQWVAINPGMTLDIVLKEDQRNIEKKEISTIYLFQKTLCCQMSHKKTLQISYGKSWGPCKLVEISS